MGEVPLWYRVIKTAEQFGVGPWELVDKPMAWIEMAEAARAAEHHAEEHHANRKRPGSRT